MFKKLGSIALGSALAFSLAACEDSSNKSATDTKDAPKQEKKNDIQTDSTKSEETSKDSGSKQNSSKKVYQLYQLNESIKMKEIELTITKAEEKNTVGSEYIKKTVYSGGTFVAIQYDIKNITDKTTGYALPAIRLMNEKGHKYNADEEASDKYAEETKIDSYTIHSDISPGSHVTRTKVFELLKENYDTGKWYVTIGTEYKVRIK
ncbi:MULTISPECIES: DUF4352 domain-containing protein [unclassified Bacillus cereus group]|uniref:DUF4352 domain-containing protein n=1 Tax=unclassified Bacillus cereus group TaxID=2750818 RepID=UPI0022E36A2D|nr:MULTISPECIES: DUF4352 domain-containing protein [unclassified Bacillus cereus group]MDA1652703.1 DUF4352 domain-containing protein [Bacillus cereus group sp. TH160LC]MDA1802681.1 DUF4352 domain-containing protein [Bacillus cereus group sp. BY6-1LC]